MVDTTSPDYLAGVAAGRASFRLHLTYSLRGERHQLLNNTPVAVLASAPSGGQVDFGPYQLLFLDSMPNAETYPDLEQDTAA